MQAHIGRVATIKTMAVGATFKLCVFNECTLVKRGEVAFVNAHLAPHLIAWLNQTVTETIIDAVWTHVDREGAIGMPTVIKFGRNSNTQRVATILTKQGMPVIKVEIYRFFTLTMQTVSVAV